jgi:hypothetical protein
LWCCYCRCCFHRERFGPRLKNSAIGIDLCDD